MDRGSPVKPVYPSSGVESKPESGLPLYLREAAPDPLQTEKLLYLVHRMRQMQENQSPPHSAESLLHPFSSTFSSSPTDQPLDFSAAKKIKREDVSTGTFWGEHRSHDSGVSDLSYLHSTHSPPLSIDSPREGVIQLGSSASTLSLPRLSISPPRSTPSPEDTKEGLLTMANPQQPNATNMFMAAATGQFPNPHEHGNDMSGLLKLAGMASTMPSLHAAGGSHAFPLSFMHKPVFPPPLSSSSPLQQGFSQHNPESMSEMARIAASSNQKYAEFRDSMLKNIDGGSSHNIQHKLNTSSKSGGGLRTTPEPGSPAHASTPTTGASAQGLTSSIDSGCESPGGTKLTKDEAYWERRRKNNEAAKRSRDARRQKETEIAMRAQFLEQENIQLKLELVQMKTQLTSIREQFNRGQIAI